MSDSARIIAQKFLAVIATALVLAGLWLEPTWKLIGTAVVVLAWYAALTPPIDRGQRG